MLKLQTHMIKILITANKQFIIRILIHLTRSQRGVVVRVTDFNLVVPGSNPIELGVFLRNCANY